MKRPDGLIGRHGQLRFVFERGRACPFFVCEACGSTLTEPGLCMIVWDMEKEESGDYVLYPVHKRACLREVERRIKSDGERLGSIELETFIGQLTQNSGYRVAGTVECWDIGSFYRLKRRKRSEKSAA